MGFRIRLKTLSGAPSSINPHLTAQASALEKRQPTKHGKQRHLRHQDAAVVYGGLLPHSTRDAHSERIEGGG